MAVWETLGSNDLRITTSTNRNLKGWTPSSAAALEEYRSNIATLVLNTEEGAIFDPNSTNQDLACISDMIIENAISIEHYTKTSQIKDVSKRPPELKEAEEASRLAATPADKRFGRSLSQRLRRRWKAEIALSKVTGKSRTRNQISRLMCDSELTTDRSLWAKELRNHCESKYVDTNFDDVRARYFRSVAQDLREQPTGLSGGWDFHTTLSARSRVVKGKAGSKDELFPEMLLSLPASVAFAIHCVFLERFKGFVRGEPCDWRQLLVILLAKL